METNHDNERLDEAKMGVIARADTPDSEAKMASIDVGRTIRGLTTERENEIRSIILDATIQDLKRVAKLYLSDFSTASRVVITGKQNRAECENM